MQDVLDRFLFEHAPVRGELVQLDATIAEVLSRHPYPAPLARLIGELMAAAALLTATVKLQGALVMQLHGTGAVKLIVVECSSDMTMRALELGAYDFILKPSAKALPTPQKPWTK